MSTRITCRIIFLLATVATAFASADEQHAVIIINGEKELRNVIKGNEFVAIEFFAPWCGHCKALAPEWEEAAKTLNETGKRIALASVDCTTESNKPLATKYGVRGFPTIKLFANHDVEKPREYEGPRNAKGIVPYLTKQAGPASLLLSDAAALTAFRKFEADKDTVVVGVFPASASGDDFGAFKAAAEALRSEYEIGHVTDAALIPEAKGATIVVFKADEKAPVVTYDGKLTEAEITAWVEKVTSPAVVTLDQNPKNRKPLQKLFNSPLPKLLGFATKGKGDDAIKDALTALSDEVSDLGFAYGDTEGNKGALDYFGLKTEEVPAYVIHDQGAGDLKYTFKNAKPSDLKSFYADFKAGKLERTVKSEEPPASNDGPVTILTAKTFNDLVFGKPRNVFIEFYAPWCGHCKKLVPTWERLGKAFQDNDSVVIAKLDATANDIPDTKKFQVTGFPTLKLVKADGEIISYDGDRSEKSLLEFVNSHADSKAVYKDEL